MNMHIRITIILIIGLVCCFLDLGEGHQYTQDLVLLASMIPNPLPAIQSLPCLGQNGEAVAPATLSSPKPKLN